MNVKASNTAIAYCPNVTAVTNWCTAGTPDLTITAVPNRVNAGDVSKLTWSADNVIGQGTVCTVTGPGVSWSSPVSASPTCEVASTTTTTIATQSTYTLACGAHSESVTVNVIPEFTEF